MSIGPAPPVVVSAAGAPLSQTAGAETERVQKETAARQRQTDAERRAEQAGGIGPAEQDAESEERDADGRRLWEQPRGAAKSPPENEPPRRPVKDPSGVAGNALDLTG